MKKYAFIFSLLVGTLSWSQATLSDTSLIINKLNKGQEIYRNKPAKAKTLWLDALFISNELLERKYTKEHRKNLLVFKSDLLFNLSQIYRNEGDAEQTIYYLKQALKIDEALHNKSNMSSSYNDLGVIYSDVGLFDKALEYYLLSLKMDRELNNLQGVASSLNNLGYLHSGQDNYKEALDFFNQSLAIQTKNNDSLGMAVSLNNLSSVYFSLHKYHTSIENAEKSISLATPFKAKSSIANAHSRIGSNYLSLKNFKKAKYHYQKALTLRKEIKEKDGIFTSLIDLSSLLASKDSLTEAITYAEKAYAISKETKFPTHKSQASEQLSSLYFEIGAFKNAYSFLKIFQETEKEIKQKDKSNALFEKQYEQQYESFRVRDSLISLKNEADLRAQVEQEKYQSDLKDQAALDQKKQTRNNFIYFSIFVVILLVVIIILVKNNKDKKKANELIAQQKLKVEEANGQLAHKNREILDSINYAKRIQSALLPPDKEVQRLLSDSFILYKPKDIVAGDFYWIEEYENKVLFAAADCTGHGVPGAMVSVFCNNGLNRSVREHQLSIPGEILNKTREIVVEEFEKSEEAVRDGMDIALCSLENNQLSYAGANNPLWIIRKGTNKIHEIKANKQPIGKFEPSIPYKTHTLEVNSGDIVYLFSDGFSDQFGGIKGKKFKSKNFKELLLSIKDKKMSQQHDLLNESFENWRGDLEQLDDVCVIGFRI